MAIREIITANCENGQLSKSKIARQWDDQGTLIQFAGYPEPETDEELIFRLIVWMRASEDAEPVELPPIELEADQWLISNYYTQLPQMLRFQLCITNEAGTYEKHSPIFSGIVDKSLSHNGEGAEIDVIPLFDPYKKYVDELILDAGARVVDTELDEDSDHLVENQAVAKAVANVNGRLEKYDNPFQSDVFDEYVSGIVRINILDKAASTYKSYRINRLYKNTTYHWNMRVQGSDDETTWETIGDINIPYDAEAAYPRVETMLSTNGAFSATIDWNYVREDAIAASTLDYRLKNSVVYTPFSDALDNIKTAQSDISTLKLDEQMYTSVFSVPLPASEYDLVKGIADVKIYNNIYIKYQEYRISQIRHNSSYHLYAALQGYDGTTWTNVDTWLVPIANAPNPIPVIEQFDSNYHRATLTIVWPLMGTSFSLTSKDYRLKTPYSLPIIGMRGKIDAVKAEAELNPFELSDQVNYRTNVVIVDANGNGDFTTIADAYASITDSAFDNQYEVIVYPGTYTENNLIPPVYTHTHGIFPGQTIVDSTGLFDSDHPDYSVFDQQYGPSKLSNMVIKSQTKYCVHQDIELNKVMLLNENLTCIKLSGGHPTNNACIGIGADFGGAKFIWRNCTFIGGPVTSHTNPNNLPNANQHIIYENCNFVNAYVNLLVSGNPLGEYVCEVKGCKSNAGSGSVTMVIGADRAGISINAPWQVIGGGNNFPIIMLTNSGTVTDVLWDNISLTEKNNVVATASVAKGKFVTISGTVADGTTPVADIAGQAVANAANGDYLPVWSGPIMYTASNGEYGIDENGDLSNAASIKIGRVYGNRFYPYY